jgi:hypothetical protein
VCLGKVLVFGHFLHLFIDVPHSVNLERYSLVLGDLITVVLMHGFVMYTIEHCLCIYARTAREEKDWTRRRWKLRKTADFSSLYFNDFNDCTALLEAITMEPVIRSSQVFLICGQ